MNSVANEPLRATMAAGKKKNHARLFVNFTVFILDNLKMIFFTSSQLLHSELRSLIRLPFCICNSCFKSAGDKQVEVIEGWAQHVLLYADYNSL